MAIEMFGWVLLFCSDGSNGPVCLPPQGMPAREVCEYIGQKMVELSSSKSPPSAIGRYACINTVKRP
jgi:hypothetical protein